MENSSKSDYTLQLQPINLSQSSSPLLSSPISPVSGPSKPQLAQTHILLHDSDSEQELSQGKAWPLDPCKDKHSDEEEGESQKGKQNTTGAEEEGETEKQWLKGKQSEGDGGEVVVAGSSGSDPLLPPHHTQGNPTCNLLLFISWEIGGGCFVTCQNNCLISSLQTNKGEDHVLYGSKQIYYYFCYYYWLTIIIVYLESNNTYICTQKDAEKIKLISILDHG